MGPKERLFLVLKGSGGLTPYGRTAWGWGGLAHLAFYPSTAGILHLNIWVIAHHAWERATPSHTGRVPRKMDRPTHTHILYAHTHMHTHTRSGAQATLSERSSTTRCVLVQLPASISEAVCVSTTVMAGVWERRRADERTIFRLSRIGVK